MSNELDQIEARLANSIMAAMGCDRRAHYGNVEQPFCGKHGHYGQWPCPEAATVADTLTPLLTLARKQAAALEAVKALHEYAHVDVETWASGYRYTGDHCAFDGEHWPCVTIEALEATK